jgi:hypothetical protein
MCSSVTRMGTCSSSRHRAAVRLANVRIRDFPKHYLEGPPFGAQFAWPGATSPAQITVRLQAGREYALLCTLRDSSTAPMHAALGMLRVLRVK